MTIIAWGKWLNKQNEKNVCDTEKSKGMCQRIRAASILSLNMNIKMKKLWAKKNEQRHYIGTKERGWKTILNIVRMQKFSEIFTGNCEINIERNSAFGIFIIFWHFKFKKKLFFMKLQFETTGCQKHFKIFENFTKLTKTFQNCQKPSECCRKLFFKIVENLSKMSKNSVSCQKSIENLSKTFFYRYYS